MAIHLVNCHIIDCVRPEPVGLASVVVDQGIVIHIRGRESAGETQQPGDLLVDLEGGYLMPGLWDAHAHLGVTLPQNDLSTRPPHEAAAFRTVRAGANAREALYAGITAIRVVGEADLVDVAWKRAFELGTWDGPRLFVCGTALAATGGHATNSGLAIEVDGADAFRHAARLQFRNGADQLKLMVTGGVGSSSKEKVDEVELAEDEIRAAVEVAHAHGAPAGAHVGGPRGAKLAIACGIDVLEHGYVLDDEAIELMLERGTYLVPTLCATQLETEDYRADGWAEYAIENSQRIATYHRQSFTRALQAGVKIASGEDTHSIARYAAREVELLVECGMKPLQALIAATRIPATICGVANRLGTVEEGKAADLIATRRNPLEDIRELRAPFLVMSRGKIVRGPAD